MLTFVSGWKCVEIQCSTISVVAGIGDGMNGSLERASPPWSSEALPDCRRARGRSASATNLVGQWQLHNWLTFLRLCDRSQAQTLSWTRPRADPKTGAASRPETRPPNDVPPHLGDIV